MAEQNNQAERAAPELLPCPFCGGTNIDPAEWSGNDGKSGPGCGDCGALGESIEAWNRRAALPASVDAVDLPPLPEMMGVADLGSVMETPDGWDEDYRATWQQLQVADCNRRQWRAYALELRGIIAADRRKQAMTQQASIGSIDEDEEFRILLRAFENTPHTARAALIAYIDGRTAAIEAHNKAGKEQG